MTRRDELERYIKAAEFIRNKGFNVVTFFNNTELELKNSLNEVEEIIINLERGRLNG